MATNPSDPVMQLNKKTHSWRLWVLLYQSSSLSVEYSMQNLLRDGLKDFFIFFLLVLVEMKRSFSFTEQDQINIRDWNQKTSHFPEVLIEVSDKT